MQRHPALPLTIALAFMVASVFGCSTSGSDEPLGSVDQVSAELGKEAPDFTLTDEDGNEVSLSDYRGKVVYIDFWASWCGPCLAFLPEMKDLWNRHKGEEFVILGVSLDFDRDTWRSFLESENIDWPNVYNGNVATSALAVYGVTAIPRTYLVDKEGTIVGIDLHTNEALLDEALETYLNQ